MTQRQNACLTCHHARFLRDFPGMVKCQQTGAQESVLRLCDDFWHIADRFKLAPFDGLPSCSASTTATNCPSGQNQAVFS